jgi:hypothetical protein
MERLTKQFKAQEDVVRKAAFTNASYGKRLEELKVGLQKKHADVQAANRRVHEAEENREEAEIEKAKTEQRYKILQEETVDAGMHKITAIKLQKAEEFGRAVAEELRQLKIDADTEAGALKGQIDELDATVARKQLIIDLKKQEEEDALKRGGTASQKAQAEIDALKARREELHALRREADARAEEAEAARAVATQKLKANEKEMARCAARPLPN